MGLLRSVGAFLKGLLYALDGLRKVLHLVLLLIIFGALLAFSHTTLPIIPHRAALDALADHRNNRFWIEGNFGDQNHVCTAGDACMKRDETGVATHQLEHHHPVMRLGGGMELVDGFRGGGDRGVESESHFRAANVVVDGFGDADDRRAFLIEFMGDAQGPVSAQDKKRIHFEMLDPPDDLIRDVDHHLFAIPDDLPGIRVAAVRRAQDRAAAREQPAHAVDGERHDPLLIHKTIIPVANPQNLTVIFVNGGLHRSADDRVQTGRVTAPGQDSDSFHGMLLCGNHTADRRPRLSPEI